MTVKRIRDFAPTGQRVEWYSIKNLATGDAEVSIYNDIGYMGVTADSFIRDLGKVKGALTLRLNSGGGEVFDGLAIYNALKAREHPVRVVIDGIAASIASVIAQAASPGQLAIGKRAQMMIHDGYTAIEGNAADFRKTAELLDQQSDNIAGVYADRTGKPASYWRDKMRDETWYDGEKAVAEGLADRVFEPVQKNSLRNENAGWVQRDGKWVFDPDNDGDDDSTPEGDTDHDYFDADGKQIKSIPPNPATGKGGQPLTGDQSGVEAKAGKKKARKAAVFGADKYKQADRDAMAKSGQALPDGSYPIADAEDLDNAIHAVGRGGADHDTIRAHIIKRAAALKLSSQIPDNWNADGSLSDASNHIDPRLLQALFTASLRREA